MYSTTEAHWPRAHALQQEKALQWEGCTLQLESVPHHNYREKPEQQQRLSKAKNKQINNLKSDIR